MKDRLLTLGVVIATAANWCVCRIVEDKTETSVEETVKTTSYEPQREREYPPRNGEFGRFDPFRPAATRSFYVR